MTDILSDVCVEEEEGSILKGSRKWQKWLQLFGQQSDIGHGQYDEGRILNKVKKEGGELACLLRDA